MTPKVRGIYRNFILGFGFLALLLLSLRHFTTGYLFFGLFIGMIAGDCSAPFVVEEETEMKNEQGFTVIELLIVMVIVGICLVLGLAVGYGGHKVYQHYNQPTSTQRLN